MVWKRASLSSSRCRVSSKGWGSPSCCGSFFLKRWPTSNLQNTFTLSYPFSSGYLTSKSNAHGKCNLIGGQAHSRIAYILICLDKN